MEYTTVVDKLVQSEHSEPLLSNELMALINVISGAVMGAIAFFGVVFNSVNAVVFFKMGLRDPVNITLLGLSLADLGSSLILLLMSCFSYPDLVLDYLAIPYLIGWLQIGFTRISSCLTAFITLERYLCVALPLRVKSIITPARTAAIVSGIFFSMLSSQIPPFFASKVVSIPNGLTNGTMMTLMYAPNGHDLENVSVTINNVTLLATFPGVIVCTALLVNELLRKTKWRQVNSSSAQNDTMTVRDQRVVKMITSISTIFILSYLPVAMVTATMLAYPDFSVTGQHSNVFTVVWGLTFLAEGLNATTGIFVYLKMSSRFRSVVVAMFRLSAEGHGSILHSKQFSD
ncbi:unnamed protein product [Lymnaea stagnalis]|uniref:G-protein coupled receptors family 1 profile domain-containing protein n=1 Tax=Lymnaea stagnalis TaxID=6523 RepID=A0AAV2HF52_LYMST